ncbi:MAG: acylneuraminate cytidylyltransferase family protein [Promethearchaeota archaeon]
MYKNNTILAVVPARGGSKGIKLKNIYPLNNRPLISYTADIIKELDFIDRAIVSTDSEQIANIARYHGLDVPFYRPENLSGDRVGDWDVLLHALLQMEKIDRKKYDIILMLQPTSPLRKTQHVKITVKKLVDNGYDSVWTISPTDSKAHPKKQLVIKDGFLHYYHPHGSDIIARQDLDPVYHRNGVAYAITRNCLIKNKNIKGEKTGFLIIDEPVSNIDTKMDILFTEFLLSCFKPGEERREK